MSTSRYPYSGSQSGSLISEITQHFTPEVVRSARSMTGESESSTFKALHAAAPTVLSGMANMASSSSGANDLASMIKEGGYGGLTENPMSLFRGGSATSYLASAGERQFGKIFGGNASSVTELVAKSGGVSASSATKLLSLITPLTLGAIGKRMTAQEGGSSGLTELLSRQRDEIEAAAPSGLSRILGLGPRPVPAPVRTVEDVETVEHESYEVHDSPAYVEHIPEPATPVERPKVEPTPVAERPRLEPTNFGDRTAPALQRGRTAGGLGWLPLLLLILAGIVLFGYLFSRSRAHRISDLGSRGVTLARNTMARVALPGGVNLAVPQGSINQQLATFLGSNTPAAVPKTFTFDHLNFETGSTQLTPESNKTVDDLGQILKAYPSAQVQLTGHTDNTGNPQQNQALSLDRANAIKAMLVNHGIGADRISTQGFGQDRPIASNATEQGQAQNRRTELTVTRR